MATVEYHRAWRAKNRERFDAKAAAWRAANQDKVRAIQARHNAKPHRKLPRGDTKARQERYRARHPEVLRQRKRDYQTRRRLDPVERVMDAMRRRVRHVCNGNARGCLVLFGYTASELRAHLQSHFKPGMSWDNYGQWHVDHRRPVSAFVLPAQMTECFALSNLQPLWASENLSKHAREG